jgi:hypothetical protein
VVWAFPHHEVCDISSSAVLPETGVIEAHPHFSRREKWGTRLPKEDSPHNSQQNSHPSEGNLGRATAPIRGCSTAVIPLFQLDEEQDENRPYSHGYRKLSYGGIPQRASAWKRKGEQEHGYSREYSQEQFTLPGHG